MADEQVDRRTAELLGGAVAGDLTSDERGELDALLTRRPDLRAELATLRDLAGRVARHGPDRWLEPEVTGPEVSGTEVTGTELPGPEGSGREVSRTDVVADIGSRRRTGAGWRGVAVAAAVAGVVGAGTGWWGAGLAGRPAAGPPGELGAYEAVEMRPAPGVGGELEVETYVVAHTWGTETVIEVEGLEPGAVYDVVVDSGGVDVPAGSFRATAEAVDCRLTSAVLRGDAAAVRVLRDGADVLTAELPPVDA